MGLLRHGAQDQRRHRQGRAGQFQARRHRRGGGQQRRRSIARGQAHHGNRVEGSEEGSADAAQRRQGRNSAGGPRRCDEGGQPLAWVGLVGRTLVRRESHDCCPLE